MNFWTLHELLDTSTETFAFCRQLIQINSTCMGIRLKCELQPFRQSESLTNRLIDSENFEVEELASNRLSIGGQL